MVINGKEIAEKIYKSINVVGKELTIVLATNDFASIKYATLKKKKGEELGVKISIIDLPEDRNIVIKTITDLNKSPTNGIIVQLPLYKSLSDSTTEILEYILPQKDVDGLTKASLSNTFFYTPKKIIPATVKAIIRILEEIALSQKVELNTFLKFKNTLIINNSNLIGKPLANVLSQYNSTVLVANKYTPNIKELLKIADITVSATGKGALFMAKDIKNGSIVIDVTSVFENGKSHGDFVYNDSLIGKTEYLTPVPGGVGPVTIASLFENLSLL